MRQSAPIRTFCLPAVYQDEPNSPDSGVLQDTPGTSTSDGTDSADAEVLQVHQSSGFLNRVRWFDSGRGHSREAVSEVAFRVCAGPYAPFELVSVYEPSTTRRFRVGLRPKFRIEVTQQAATDIDH
jgi:hypothetical protein